VGSGHFYIKLYIFIKLQKKVEEAIVKTLA